MTMLSHLAAEPEEKTEVNFDDEPDAHLVNEAPVTVVVPLESDKQEEQSEPAADVDKTERNSDSRTIAGKSRPKARPPKLPLS